MLVKKAIKRLIGYYHNMITHAINFVYPIKFGFCKNKMGVYGGKNREREVIISLTSFPARIGKVHLCLQSLLLQKLKPDRIVLWLGKEEFENVTIPDELQELTANGVEIRFRKDLKPHTKYFYAMQEFTEALIITVDDDCYYRPNLVGDLLSVHYIYPDEVLCTRAHKMRYEGSELLPYKQWDYETEDVGSSSHYLMATGVGGVLYPPHCMPKEAFDDRAVVTLCPKADDVWLKAMEILNGVKVRALPSNKTKYVVGVNGTQEFALDRMNVGFNRNDIYLKQVFNAYHINVGELE